MTKLSEKRITQLASRVGCQLDESGNVPREVEDLVDLVVKDCLITIQRRMLRNGDTPENRQSRLHLNDIAYKYGIKFPIEYFE